MPLPHAPAKSRDSENLSNSTAAMRLRSFAMNIQASTRMLLAAMLLLAGLTACAASGISSPVPSSSALNSAASPTRATSAPPVKKKRSPAKTRSAKRPKSHAATPPAPNAAPPSSAQAVPAPAGCYPLSSKGTCYEPGEYCRDSDHGATGRAGEGEAIVCTYNDGWRWEPS